jgi:hypothetical protein
MHTWGGVDSGNTREITQELTISFNFNDISKTYAVNFSNDFIME